MLPGSLLLRSRVQAAPHRGEQAVPHAGSEQSAGLAAGGTGVRLLLEPPNEAASHAGLGDMEQPEAPTEGLLWGAGGCRPLCRQEGAVLSQSRPPPQFSHIKADR